MNEGEGSGDNDTGWPPGNEDWVSQIVTIDSQFQHFHFGFWSVEHGYDIATGKLYGADSTTGPWKLVWTIFEELPRPNPDPPGQGNDWIWLERDIMIEEGFQYWKLEFHGKRGDSDDAWKFTNVHLWAD